MRRCWRGRTSGATCKGICVCSHRIHTTKKRDLCMWYIPCKHISGIGTCRCRSAYGLELTTADSMAMPFSPSSLNRTGTQMQSVRSGWTLLWLHVLPSATQQLSASHGLPQSIMLYVMQTHLTSASRYSWENLLIAMVRFRKRPRG